MTNVRSDFYKKCWFKIIYAYAFVQCFNTFNEGIMSILSNILGLVIFIYLCFIIYTKKLKIKDFNILMILTIYFIFQYLYLYIQGILDYNSIFQGIKIAILLLIIIYYSNFDINKDEIKKYILTVNKMVYFSIILCYVIYRRFSFKSYYGGNEFYGFLSNPHSIGLGLIAITLYLINSLRNSSNKNHKYIYTFILINTFIIIALNVRTYLISYLISLILYFMFTNKSIDVKKLKYLLYTACIVIIFLIVNNKLNLIDIRELNSGGDGKTTLQSITSGRSVFWYRYYEYVKQQDYIYKLFGRGIGSTKYIMQDLGMKIGTHNDFLQVFGEYGILGLSMFLIFIGSVTFKFIAIKKNRLALSIIGSWIIAAFINGSMYYTFSMMLVIMVLYSFIYDAKY